MRGISAARPEFILDVRTSLLIASSIGELDGYEAVPLVEPASSQVLLEGPQANWRGEHLNRVYEQLRTNALAHERRLYGHLGDQRVDWPCGGRHGTNDTSVDLGDPNASGRKEFGRHPGSDVLVGVR